MSCWPASARSSSCTPSRAGPRPSRCTRRSGSPRASGRTAAGGWTSPVGPTTPGRRGWPTGRNRRCPTAPPGLAAREYSGGRGTLATFGKVVAEPGGVNGISSLVRAWLDARAPDQARLDQTVADITAAARDAARTHGVEVSVTSESVTPPVGFDPALRDRVAAVLA